MISHVKTSYGDIKNKEEIKGDLLKPIHLYAQHISPKPIQNKNIFTQLLYAEVLINFTGNDKIFLVSRAATQQFKMIKEFDENAPEDCFKTLYAFYVSWFIDKDTDVLIKQSNDDIVIPEEIKVNFKNIYPEPRDKLEEIWVPFYIKKKSQYIKDDYGKLDLDMPIYDIMIDYE
jgi:hypothetical protein